MRLAVLPLSGLLLAGVVSAATAALTESQFPPRTVRDLVAICTPAKDDPLMTAAVNYCHGFAEGAVIVHVAHGSQRGGRKLFCLPQPPPPRGAELDSLVAWAGEDPTRLDRPAIDGMFLYLAQKFPCDKKQ